MWTFLVKNVSTMEYKTTLNFLDFYLVWVICMAKLKMVFGFKQVLGTLGPKDRNKALQKMLKGAWKCSL